MERSQFVPAIQSLLRGRITALPGHIQAVFVQNALKLFARALGRGGVTEKV